MMNSKLFKISLMTVMIINGLMMGDIYSSEAKISQDAKPLKAFQVDLLNIAFDSASSYPLVPHIKNRSRAQELVVKAALSLDQPDLAFDFTGQIKNWRRGLGYAYWAQYQIKNGQTDNVVKILEKATQISDAVEQIFRKNELKEAIATAYGLLGEFDKALDVDGTMDELSSDKATAMKAIREHKQDFEQQVHALDSLMATEQYEMMKYAIHQYANLYNQFFNDLDKRTQLTNRIDDGLALLPAFFKFEVRTKMINYALGRNDKAEAMNQVEITQKIVDSKGFALDQYIVNMAELSQYRYRSDDKERALKEIGSALEFYKEQRTNLKNTQRANPLRKMAEAYMTMGDQKMAASVFRQAVIEGAQNPNIRPRTDNLTATCLSMALSGFEPDAELWEQIKAIRSKLGAKPKQL